MKNMKKQGKKHFSGKGLSIKQKVTLWYACMLVLIVLLLFGFIFSISRSLLQRESDSRLEEVVLDFVDDIDFENGSYELDDDIRFYEDGVIFSIYDEQGRLIAGSVPTNFPADTVLKAIPFQTFSTGESTWSVYDAALSQGGQILWIRGILPSETLFSVERTMLLVLLIACPLLIAVALLVGYSITRRAFLPIEEIRQTAETIGAGLETCLRASPRNVPRVKSGSLLIPSMKCSNAWRPPSSMSASLPLTLPMSCALLWLSSLPRRNMPCSPMRHRRSRKKDWKLSWSRPERCPL